VNELRGYDGHRGTVASNLATFTQTGGTLAGGGTLSVSGMFTWSGSTESGPGTTTVTTASLNTSTSALVVQGRPINSSGTTTWATGTNDLQLNSGAVWNNLSGGLFNIQVNANVTATQGTGTFNNQGTFRKSLGMGTTTVGTLVAFNNTGKVDVQTGTLNSRPTLWRTSVRAAQGEQERPRHTGRVARCPKLQVTSTFSIM
jgi:hypothetical protein